MKDKFKSRILEDLTTTQKYTLVLLGVDSHSSVKGNLWLQKELFLLANLYEDLEEESGFEPYLLGPHSEFVEEEIDDLSQSGLVERMGSKLKLTEDGKDIYSVIAKHIDGKDLEVILDIKEFLNDLTEDELLGFIYFSYPKMRKESIKFETIKNNRENIAIKLFKKGKISTEKASEIAGISIENLIQKMKMQGIQVYG